MVNPVTYPVLRRGNAGPETNFSGAGDFEPFDNEIYFDPDYVGSTETGGIGAPHTTWNGWVAAIGSDAWRVMFPGYEVTASDAIPLADNISITIQGVNAHVTDGSHIAGTTQVLNPATESSLHFKNISLEILELNGGDYSLIFTDCIVDDLLEAGGSYEGTLFGFNTSFGLLTSLPAATARLTGGNIIQLTALELYLDNLVIGNASEATAGDIIAEGTIIVCHDVTFVPGSTIVFAGAAGELFLDGPSYKSFLDNDISLTNGHVTRDDGSWPVDALLYSSVGGAGESINFTKNPRAILEYEENFSCTFLAPLTREVQILLINTGTGGPIDWPANVKWSDGTPPELPTDTGAETLLRFDYEESLDFYYGWVALMDAQVEP